MSARHGKSLPSTPALRALRAVAAEFRVHRYRYTPRGGSGASAIALNLDEHIIIKTLVFETEARAPLIVLMHGDRSVSSKQLARQLNTKSCRPAPPHVAERHTGYRVGGTSPWGLRKPLPIYAQETIFELDEIYLNGGQRGLLVSLHPATLERMLAPQWIDVAI